jgi:predicted DsbA family dithiol-disulfide isomerase
MAERLREMFESNGLPYSGGLDKVPNSRRALMLGELARERGVFEALHSRLFDAYWARARDVGDEGVLVEEATAVGLEKAEIVEAIHDGRYGGLVAEQTRAAIELGAGGVPAWVIDERLLVPGAQPHDLFSRTLERLGHEPLDGA